MLALFIIFSLPVFSQEEFQFSTNQKTEIPLDARFELIQSTLAAKGTYKFDRFKGDVYVFVVREDSTNTWEKMVREENFMDFGQTKDHVNYQLFLSGLAFKFSFLMNIRTGLVWQLVSKSNGDLFWEVVK